MIERLHAAISAVCPINGISVDGQSVRIDFKPEATTQEQAAAEAAVSNFDWSDVAHAIWLDNQEPLLKTLRDQADQGIADIEAYLAIADAATNAQVRAEVKAIDQRQKRIIQALKRLVQREWR